MQIDPDISHTSTRVTDEVAARRTSSWDLANAPRNYVWLVAFQFAGAAFGFAASWLLSQHLEPEGFGAVFLVLAASQIVQIFVNWSTVAVVRFGVDEFVETAKIARTFWIRGAILLVNLVLLLAVAWAWFPPLSKALKLAPELYWLVIMHFVVTTLWVHVQMGMQAAKMLREQGLLLAFERVVIAAAVGTIFLAGVLTVTSAVVCYVMAAGLLTIVGVVRLRSLIFHRFDLDVTFFKKILVYSVPLLPYWVIGYLSSSYLDAVFITAFLSKADFGVYNVAVQISGLVMQVPTIANTILFPLFITQRAESGDERSFFFFRHILPGLVLVWGAACSVAAFVAYYAVPVIFKSKYAGASQPLWILLAATAFWIPVALGYAALANAMSSTYMSLAATAFAAVANIGGNYIMIPRFGLAGCAWATMLAYAASAVVFGLLLNRWSRLPLSWTFVAFLPSFLGSYVVFSWESPLGAVMVALASSAVVAVFAKSSLGHMAKFLYSLRRSSGEAHQAA